MGSAIVAQGQQEPVTPDVDSAKQQSAASVAYPVVLPDKRVGFYVIADNTHGGVLLEQVSSNEVVLLFPLRRDLLEGQIVVTGIRESSGAPTAIPAENDWRSGVAGVRLHLSELASFLHVDIAFKPVQGEALKLLSIRGPSAVEEAKPVGPPTLRFECQNSEGCTLTLYTRDETGQVLATPIPMEFQQALYSTGALGITCTDCAVSVVK